MGFVAKGFPAKEHGAPLFQGLPDGWNMAAHPRHALHPNPRSGRPGSAWQHGWQALAGELIN